MLGSAEYVWAGEKLLLLRERALWWQRTSTLFITDPHFGKGATFRSEGIPLPPGSTEDDLRRLTLILDAIQARRLVVLGDFFHASSSRKSDVLIQLTEWRRQHAALQIVLVVGNHDRHAGMPPAHWEIDTTEELATPPFLCVHHPMETAALASLEDDAYVLSGHIHPVVKLSGSGHTPLRLPCFYFQGRQAVLPAFGSFTGGYCVKPQKGEQIFVVGPGAVLG